MVWAALRGDGCLVFDFPENDPEAQRNGVTSRTYLNMLKEKLPAIMGEDSILMQDNATARKVYEWLREM